MICYRKSTGKVSGSFRGFVLVPTAGEHYRSDGAVKLSFDVRTLLVWPWVVWQAFSGLLPLVQPLLGFPCRLPLLGFSCWLSCRILLAAVLVTGFAAACLVLCRLPDCRHLRAATVLTAYWLACSGLSAL